jgi:hypothetical protein
VDHAAGRIRLDSPFASDNEATSTKQAEKGERYQKRDCLLAES